MPIEWPGSVSSAMNVTVEDNTGNPISILQADAPFNVKITWTVPADFVGILNGSGSSFRLRVYAESIGPGQEQQIGPTEIVPENGGGAYDKKILVNANTLVGESLGVSGVYKIVAVLQLLNGAGIANDVSGFAEAPVRLFRLP